MKKGIFLFVLLSITTVVYGWDGKRDGFILGGGLGGGSTIYKQTLKNIYSGAQIESDVTTSFSFQTNFQIGFAPSEYLEIYWSSKQSWFGLTNIYGDKVIILTGVAGVGVSYFFFKNAPSPFVSGTLGYSTWGTSDETSYGVGMCIGGGYEFYPHFSVDGDIVWGNPSDTQGGIELTTGVVGLRVTVNVCGY
ncbi:MAG: hypothetical protein PHE49_03100 [bacterium]|nr:hypothetical protein [bacterium]